MSQETSGAFDLVPHSPVRKAIAARVVQSRREIPTFCLTARADASALVATRESLKESGGAEWVGPSLSSGDPPKVGAEPIRPTRTGRMDPFPSAVAEGPLPFGPSICPTYNDLLIYLTARALRAHPRLNSHFSDEGLRIFHQVNMGFAVATEVGVLLPVIHNADRKGLEEIAREARERIELARAGKLRASLQAGATFTISNIGPGPVESFDAVINPPQVAILSVGSLALRAIVVDGRAEARPTLSLTLTVDHRALDGADGAAFLADLVAAIESVPRDAM